MSVQAMSWVFEHSNAMWGARLVLLAIANHADRDGRNSWASVPSLAVEAHLSPRQVRRSLRELESTGEIVLTGTSPHRTHIYELPAMLTLFQGGQTDPDILSAVTMTPGQTRPLTRTNRAVDPDTVSSEPKSNHPKATVLERTSGASPDAEKLCKLLVELMVANGCKRPTISKAWLTEAGRLLALDRRPYDEAERVLRWCQADPFWLTNIHSMPTFRSKYDRLRLASTRTTKRRGTWADPAGPGMRTAKLAGLDS